MREGDERPRDQLCAPEAAVHLRWRPLGDEPRDDHDQRECDRDAEERRDQGGDQNVVLDPAPLDDVGPAGVPTVLSKAVQAGTVTPGDRVMLMGVGSGINAAASEILW